MLVWAVAAALGLDLVFDVAAGGSGLDEGADGAGEVEGSSEAGIDVDEQGEGADVGDAARVGEDVVDGGDAEVGDAEGAGGDAASGEVEGAVADAFGHEGVVGVDGADDLEGVFGRDGGAKPCSGSGGWSGLAHAVRYLAEEEQGDNVSAGFAGMVITLGLHGRGGQGGKSNEEAGVSVYRSWGRSRDVRVRVIACAAELQVSPLRIAETRT